VKSQLKRGVVVPANRELSGVAGHRKATGRCADNGGFSKSWLSERGGKEALSETGSEAKQTGWRIETKMHVARNFAVRQRSNGFFSSRLNIDGTLIRYSDGRRNIDLCFAFFLRKLELMRWETVPKARRFAVPNDKALRHRARSSPQAGKWTRHVGFARQQKFKIMVKSEFG
jgi:hypothetical protein